MSAIEHLLKPHVRDIGDFSVRRVLPSAAAQTVGPFIFFDHMGPVELPPGHGMDVRPHPHIGLATVTYLFEGEIVHRDSVGSEQTIRPGDVNWMTAGSGIVHSERSPQAARDAGPRLHGIQTWVALPREHETVAPSFFHHPAATLPQLVHGGARITVIAGDAFGARSPVQVFSRTLYAALELDAGASLAIPPEHEQRGLYLVDGAAAIDGTALPAEHLAVLTPGAEATVTALEPSRLMLLGGEPVDGRRHIFWNFVASSREAIEEAARRWENDEFPHVPGETERIPLPPRRV
ncbi:pirin family protein [Cupriavidus cauae]|uniref:Pirin family protein n=1 Tax=Cupriavidus cauae TaxID=2608999 RepID=A0A5M8A668_9BURK|nr:MULTISPECIES: pirin family protein [Cupriavidus]KAA0178691.1 pirin family protein [Cupriavidus gilardii]KAA6117446.1 pirin family protein [Cupriavidus cauae]MCA7085719.1 pirin family protein [Cupriavidus sp. DB3]UZN50068.1 pirin family protein [Cupriavidus cauae]